ncbi:MAG: ATP-binding cassette domain-containing protein [Clostridiales bacterium]|nr:ATP-binding cassette domain-containing protein [Clostridiales bacterium]
MIKINHLQKYYNKGKKNEQYVLKGIDLELGNTGLVCLLGESGCGKTTLLNTVGGLDEFNGGEITVDDITVRKYDPKKIEPVRNDHFGYIFQNYYLLQDYTVGYNVRIALNRFDLTEEEKEERVDYVLEMLGMARYKKKPVSKLSGGQQQRVSIARALVKSPDVIFADEPTGNLDEENTLRTMSILKSISKTCLVLLVTHERRIANFFADRIIEIKDGEICRDEPNLAADYYERSDDANIYLKEMECHRIEDDYADFRVYCRKGDVQVPVKLNLAWKDGKLYIQNGMQCDIIIEGTDSGVQMLDKERPRFDMDELDKVSYNLERPQGTKRANLAGREIWRMATENIRLMGKKQAFVLVVLIATAILLSVTAAQFANAMMVDKSTFVTTDEHYVSVTFDRVSSLRTGDQQLKILEYIRGDMSDEDFGRLMYVPNVKIYLQGQDFAQMKRIYQYVEDFSYAPKDLVEEEDLLYGSLSGRRDDVIVDISVIEKWMDSDGVITSFYETVESYVGATLYSSSNQHSFTIVGICDTGEPDIYVSQNLLLYFGKGGYKIMSTSELAAEDADAYADIDIGDDEILIREGFFESLGAEIGDTYQMGDDEDHQYVIVGTFSNDIDATFAFNEKGCEQVVELGIYNRMNCMIYTDDTAATIKILEEYAEDYHTAFSLSTTVPYEDEVSEYLAARSVDVDAKMLITLIVTAISLVMIYFTMKSNAISRSEELTVYRLIGISRSSIIKAYVLEMMLITSYTSLPTVILSCAVIKYISAIPSLNLSLNFPLWSVAFLLAGIYVVHALISILPVAGILSKPPATLAAKE